MLVGLGSQMKKEHFMATHDPDIEKALEWRIRNWVRGQGIPDARELQHSDDIEPQVGPYIVVSREFGAGGSAIAKLVAQKLGWDLLDKEIIDYMAEVYGTPQDLVEFADEKTVSRIEKLVDSWIEGQGSNTATYVQGLTQLFILAASHGNVVIVGRGAQFILPRDRGLSVRILAPLEFRIEQVLLREGLTEKEARTLVEKSDQSRRTFMQQHFHQKSTNPHLYDLVISVEKLVQEDAANLIVAATRSWIHRTGIGE
jgi:cytidylate kinase